MVQYAHTNFFSDDPYERDFEPHKQPGPPYYMDDYTIYEYSYDEEDKDEDYSTYEYSYDNEQPYSIFADDYGTGSPFYPENVVDSYPQYDDYFDQKEVVEDVKPTNEQANGVSDANKKQLTSDNPSGQTPEDTKNPSHNGHSSESLQYHVLTARNDDTRRNKKENRTALILEPGIDHYPHNSYR